MQEPCGTGDSKWSGSSKLGKQLLDQEGRDFSVAQLFHVILRFWEFSRGLNLEFVFLVLSMVL